MVRDLAIFGIAMIGLQLAGSRAEGAPLPQTGAHQIHHPRTSVAHAEPARRIVARRHVAPEHEKRVVADEVMPPPVEVPPPPVETSAGMPTSLAYRASAAAIEAPVAEADPVLPATPPVLSDQESEVSQLADAQGDKTFIMVDKALGKIILFENGQPVFAGPALTGESLADRMPKVELGEKFDTLNALDTKITPAGRYTVQRGYDEEVGGPLFDISEIHGKDWGIAIHQLYLGIPSEHRDARILSPSDEDKHITFGCINVQPKAIRLLMHELPEKGRTPLYILPEDVSQTAAFFTPHASS
jgi:hypothetical protein